MTKEKDCSTGKIYFIRSNNPDITVKYVGSTIETLSRRMAGHRAKYKQWLNDKATSCSIYHEFKKYGVEQFHIELIEDYPCERDEQLLARENFFIRQENCVNKISAILTPEERKEQSKQYYQEHKEEHNKYTKKYYHEHKEQINTTRRKKIICVCGCEITKNSLTKHLKTEKHKSIIALKT